MRIIKGHLVLVVSTGSTTGMPELVEGPVPEPVEGWCAFAFCIIPIGNDSIEPKIETKKTNNGHYNQYFTAQLPEGLK